MTDSNGAYAGRKHLTFSQAEGLEPIPTQLRLKEISPEMRALLWVVFYQGIQSSTFINTKSYRKHVTAPWSTIITSYEIEVEYEMIDNLNLLAERIVAKVKSKFTEICSYATTFDFIQYVLRHPSCPTKFDQSIDDVLARSKSAYRVFGGDTIIPISSEEEALTLRRAFANLHHGHHKGARSHMLAAGELLAQGRYAESVRESINSVESVARLLSSSGELSTALAKLEKDRFIHGALKKGFNSIYGYTSDEKGIRHPLIDDNNARVDESDAMFMIGACAAFVSYMLSKAKNSNLI